MSIIDNDFLQSIGLDNAAPQEREALRKSLQSQLEMRVAVRLSELLPDDALKEFIAVAEREQPQIVEAWLKKYIPTYDRVIQLELEALRQDIIQQTKRATEEVQTEQSTG